MKWENRIKVAIFLWLEFWFLFYSHLTILLFYVFLSINIKTIKQFPGNMQHLHIVLLNVCFLLNGVSAKYSFLGKWRLPLTLNNCRKIGIHPGFVILYKLYLLLKKKSSFWVDYRTYALMVRSVKKNTLYTTWI